MELISFDAMWKYVFFHDFKKSRAKYGVIPACIILLLICILRGIGTVIRGESFWSGFLYPFEIFILSLVIILPLFLLGKKAPKIATIVSTVLMVLIVLFLGGVILLILGGIIAAIIA